MYELSRKKAKRMVIRHTAHGTSKREARSLALITSVGTERNYTQATSNYLEWCSQNDIAPGLRANKTVLKNYLDERSEWIQQKTLDMERQALQLLYKQKLAYVKSINPTILAKRSYTTVQANQIARCQTKRNSISTLLALHAGVRAHELATILPINERTPSQHRQWDSMRFTGFPEFVRYTVIGKGGLCREIGVPVWLSSLLEARRRNEPLQVRDRQIFYTSFYDIGFGQAWSQSFTDASKKALGFSTGGHGLRHSYAKKRLYELERAFELLIHRTNLTSAREEALKVLSQELGHFRIDVTYAYLR